MSRPKIKIINERTWQGTQSWNHELIEQIGDVRLRFKVKQDSYDMQSSAKVEVWKDMEWSMVHHIAGQVVSKKLGFSYVERDIKPERFDPVMIELRRVAEGVLGL